MISDTRVGVGVRFAFGYPGLLLDRLVGVAQLDEADHGPTRGLLRYDEGVGEKAHGVGGGT